MKTEWPSEKENPTFVRFARKLADVVTVAINSGKKVGDDIACYCPIGCHPESGSKNPFYCDGFRLFGITTKDTFAFMLAFDGGTNTVGKSPYYNLGLAYRHRFVTEAP